MPNSSLGPILGLKVLPGKELLNWQDEWKLRGVLSVHQQTAWE